MLYMSGPKDTLKELKKKEGFNGTLQTYELEFAKINPEIVANYSSYKLQLPAYMPLFLVTEPPFDPLVCRDTVRELSRFPLQIRQTLRQMQEEGHEDFSVQVALSDIMEEFQSYAKEFRQALKTPLILTPWKEFNSALTDKSLFKIFGETSSFSSNLIKKSTPFKVMDDLYEAMMKRDALSRQWHLLRNTHTKEASTLKRSLQKQVEQLSTEIRQQLPKKLKNAKSKYVYKKFTESEIRQIRSRVATARSAGKMKLLTTNMDVLNKTGLGRLRFMVDELKMLGQSVSKGAKMLNWGIVAYDTFDAYKNGGNMARTFFAGAASVVVASELTAVAGGTTALGGLVLGSLVGDAALGTTILVCSPVIGWAVLLIAGVAVAGYVTYKTKGAAEGVWDLAEDAGGKVTKETSKAVDWMHEKFKSGWNNRDSWIPEFYGDTQKTSAAAK